ncbi:hypothetical protein [Mucilaginibacter myungsuensis]|uniref:Uncharacterized protein n=1 Tax=Mucilaginibacter myungsuensis TaxID=649104 RepID=A0A929L213_9SPHI|nr:hypothetical protein [Mucilaginibacter myungsuensis]MBE9664693.1 hypothetical protein [Mucilaginibacter myungsuensis]MDN3601450.1 hypothetical protein [Mucilaginibacter myungsuensis]
MEEQFNYPANDREDLKWNKEEDMGDTPGIDSVGHKGLEQDGPNKSKPFNVLNQDGSFADYAERSDNNPHNDTNDGTLGIGK